ncbi:MAG TPA: PQQ-binding-like beta-propeller repeat protein, partial [Phytomonospora sp.]
VEVTAASVWERVRVAGDAVVVDDPAGYVVVDVATGGVRFTLRPAGEAVGALVVADHVVVFGCEGRVCTAVATRLDGGELWRDRREAVPQLPETVSTRRQTVAVANPAPLVPEPVGGVFLWRDGDERTAVDLATGIEVGSWQASAGADPRVFGGHVIDVGLSHTLRCLDPATGRALWTRATLSEPGRSGPVTFVGGLLLDSATPDNHDSPGYYQLIDPATGDIPSTPTAAGRRIIAVQPGVAVGLDPVTAELTAVRPRDSLFWRTSLRSERYGFTATGFLTGDGWLAVGEEHGGLWYVDLATGAAGNVPGGEVIGLDAGALISAGPARDRVELRELGVR